MANALNYKIYIFYKHTIFDFLSFYIFLDIAYIGIGSFETKLLIAITAKSQGKNFCDLQLPDSLDKENQFWKCRFLSNVPGRWFSSCIEGRAQT